MTDDLAEQNQRVLEALAPAAVKLYDAMIASDKRSTDDLSMYDEVTASAQSNFTRTHFSLQVKSAAPTGWRIVDGVNNDGTHLMTVEEDLIMRLRHMPGVVLPPNGASRAQFRYWSQDNLLGHQQLVAAWCIKDGEPVIEVYRPTKPWGYRGPENVNMRFIMPRTAAEVVAVSFTPVNESLDTGLFDDSSVIPQHLLQPDDGR